MNNPKAFLWMKHKLFYFIFSAILISVGLYSLFVWGVNLGIDFTGGVHATYKLPDGQIINIREGFKTEEEILTLRNEYKENGSLELKFETVGPSIGPELVKKTFYALGISAFLILLWVTIQFKSLKFGVSAILAMLHDSLILIGSFSLFGYLFGVEIDFLFVTAVLTVLSFSVHDTIVVFDRIREKQKRSPLSSISELANSALTETIVRSLNNSLTIVFMLVSLILLGGESIRWFSLALLIGTISGTYSSPFVAVPLLVTWENLEKKFKKS